MSRSNTNTQLTNPAKKFFEWNAQDGVIKHYDKETKSNVFHKLPFSFLVLDRLNTVGGYDDEAESGLWSNEVRDIRKDELIVRCKKGIYAKGLWDEIKVNPSCKSAKYVASVYIAYKENNKLELGHIKFVGSSLSSFIEFCKGKDIYNGSLTITGFTDEKKGATRFKSPTFVQGKVSAETEQQAIELDKVLQEYLTEYFLKNHSSNVGEVEEKEPNVKEQVIRPQPKAQEQDYDDDLPF